MATDVKGLLQSDTAKGLILALVTFAVGKFFNLSDATQAGQLANSVYEIILAVAGVWTTIGIRNAVSDTAVKPFGGNANK